MSGYGCSANVHTSHNVIPKDLYRRERECLCFCAFVLYQTLLAEVSVVDFNTPFTSMNTSGAIHLTGHAV